MRIVSKNKLLVFMLTVVCNYAIGQNLIQKEWQKFYSYQNLIKNTALDVNGSGDIFVSGHLENGAEGSNIVTLKYNSSGNLQWAKQFHASANDFGLKIECDNAGNVYTLGSVQTGGSTYASVLIKYNSSGTQQWVYSVALGTSNMPIDLYAKSGGNIYILSDNVISGQHDAVITSLTSSGVFVNQQTYNSGYEDTPVNIEYWSGKILLGVKTNNSGVITSAARLYNASLSLQWNFGFSGSGVDELKSVKFDNLGNVLVLVSVDTIKTAEITKISATGSFQWDLALDNDNEIFTDQSLFVDTSNNSFVAYAHNGQSEISIALIDPLGEKMWNKYYYGNNTGFENVGIISDDSRIICAASEIGISNGDFLSFSFDYNAAFQWEHKENCGNSGKLSDFCINSNNHIVLAGQAESGTGFKIALVDLSEAEAFDAPDESGNPSGPLAYFQNLERIKNMDGDIVEDLSYAGIFNDEGLYFFDNSIAFTHYKTDYDTATVDSLYRLDFLFTGAVNAVKPRGVHPVNYHNNYYTAEMQRERVNGYKKIVYPNLYDGIDLEVGENIFGPVFSFIIYPGADIGDIEWEIDGATELYGGFLDSTIINQFKEYSSPLLLKENGMGDIINIPYDSTAYGYDIDSTGKIVFNFPTMINTSNYPFIVQLNRKGTHQDRSPEDNFEWCSYIRNPGTESFVGTGVIAKITSDAENNTYYAGSVHKFDDSDGPFPTTPGAAYSLPIGANDITIMKLNDEVEIQWATYYGGTGADKAYSITTNTSGSIINLTGFSSSTDFPTLGAPGAYVESTGNSFVLETNADGTINWATKFPAELLDCELVNGNLFVVGARINAATPTLIDDGSNYYSSNGSGFIGVFQPGGFYVHGTGFGKTGTGFGLSTKITGIDWYLDSGGSTNIALTGQTKDDDFLVVNAPADHDAYLGGYGYYYNAFVSNITATGTIKFSQYISSVETNPIGGMFGGDDLFYFATGDRGNDVKFAPDGKSVYVVGEAFGDDLEVTSSANPDDYEQSSRFPAVSGISFRPAGFIYQADNSLGNEGDKLLCTYFAPNSTDDSFYGLNTRLCEISFDNLGNYYISGIMVSSSIEDSPIPAEYNVPLPYAQPIGFYQKNEPTYSTLECAGGLDREPYIIAFNSDNVHIWTTYVGGKDDDQIKPVEVTSDRHLYFGGGTVTINGGLASLCPDATPAEILEIELPVWEYDLTVGSLDWFEELGGGDQCEFAGRFDVNGVNEAGPPLSLTEKRPTANSLILYPNPNQDGNLYLFVNGEPINQVIIHSLDGKLITTINQSNIDFINLSNLAAGTYILICQTVNNTYTSKFIKN